MNRTIGTLAAGVTLAVGLAGCTVPSAHEPDVHAEPRAKTPVVVADAQPQPQPKTKTTTADEPQVEPALPILQPDVNEPFTPQLQPAAQPVAPRTSTPPTVAPKPKDPVQPEHTPPAEPAVDQEPPAEPITEDLEPLTPVRVETDNLIASGTIIGHSTDGSALVLTSEHAVDETVYVVHDERTLQVEDTACGPWWADICVLELEASKARYATAELAELGKGDTVQLTGQTSGLVSGEVLATDLVLAMENLDESVTAQSGIAELSAKVAGGDSGAGVINDRGQLVGVMEAAYTDSGHALVFAGSLFVMITGELLEAIETPSEPVDQAPNPVETVKPSEDSQPTETSKPTETIKSPAPEATAKPIETTDPKPDPSTKPETPTPVETVKPAEPEAPVAEQPKPEPVETPEPVREPEPEQTDEPAPVDPLALAPQPGWTSTAPVSVGQKLTAEPGTWGEGIELAYQWNRDGEPIEDATETVYAIRAADVGTTLSVTVTGTVEHADGSSSFKALTSTATPKVTPLIQVGEAPEGSLNFTGSVDVCHVDGHIELVLFDAEGNETTDAADLWSGREVTSATIMWNPTGRPLVGPEGLSFTSVPGEQVVIRFSAVSKLTEGEETRYQNAVTSVRLMP